MYVVVLYVLVQNRKELCKDFINFLKYQYGWRMYWYRIFMYRTVQIILWFLKIELSCGYNMMYYMLHTYFIILCIGIELCRTV